MRKLSVIYIADAFTKAYFLSTKYFYKIDWLVSLVIVPVESADVYENSIFYTVIGSYIFADLLAPKTLIVEQMNTSAIELTWFSVKDQAGVDIVWCEAKSTTFTCQVDNTFSKIRIKTYLLQNKEEVIFSYSNVLSSLNRLNYMGHAAIISKLIVLSFTPIR